MNDTRDIRDIVRTFYLKSRVINENPFDVLERYMAEGECVSSIQQLKTRENMKIRGDLFESFCQLYLLHTRKYDDVWLLRDVPDNVLSTLHLSRNDMGIDIICRKDDLFYAIQAKYRKFTGKTRVLSWKSLSTFYALCLRSGPWCSYIVMTNCNYVRRVGKKTPNDVSICLQSFRNMKHDDWIVLGQLKGYVLTESPRNIDSAESLREARIRALDAS